MSTGSLFVPTLARRQRTLTEMIRLKLALLRIEKETGKSDPGVGRNINE